MLVEVKNLLTGTVLGLLIDDGRCTLDTKAVELEVHLADRYPLYSRVKLRHLASVGRLGNGGRHLAE